MAAHAATEYPVVLEPDDNDTVLAYFPYVPGAITFGDDEDEALAYAADALVTLFSALIDGNKDIPEPGKMKRGQPAVTLPSLVASKVLLYRRMRTLGVTRAELARKLGGKSPTHVTRLLDVLHQSRHDQLDEAMAVLGARLVIGAEPLPKLRRQRPAPAA